MRQGKTVKIICVGKKGYDALKREFAQHVIKTVDLRNVKNVSFADADAIGRDLISMYENGEFDVCTLYYSSSSP
jgi:F-type H+-transporting ATPase subunit gamma